MKQLHKSRISQPNVAATFKTYPKAAARYLMYLRKLIIETTQELEGVGALEETLKWGEPSYLTSYTKSGSTVRIDWKKSDPEFVFVFFKCTSNLLPTYRKKYKTDFEYVGNRAIKIYIGAIINEDKFKNCIALALTYHNNKRLSTQARWCIVENR
jgi:hypothetical protein